ncbi:MAG: hypothetical protein ACLGIN_02630 [Candidatus Sericytochromatia bacterium]
MNTPFRLIAHALVVCLLGACQAPALAPAPVAPAAVPDAPVMVVLAADDASIPALRELDGLTLEAPLTAPISLSITYQRGVEEQVSWEGTGQGAAELRNAHGQLVYRIAEGAAAKTVTVPAGAYTLTVTPDASQPASPMLIHAAPQETGTGQVRTLTDLAEIGREVVSSRGEDEITCNALTSRLTVLADLERRLQFRRQKARFHPWVDDLSRPAAVKEYWMTRVEVTGIYERESGAIRRTCGEHLLKHEPKSIANRYPLPSIAPYLYTYYMNNITKEGGVVR